MDVQRRANEIKEIQLNAIRDLKITSFMLRAIERIAAARQSNGRIITTGMGKAGIIAQKMSATLASMGFPSFYVHPAEGLHGDVGRMAPEDLIIVFSNSGSTGEVVSLVNQAHQLNQHKNFVIHIGGTDNPKIPADLVINYGKVDESCAVKKVPSTSTTLMLVIADILAIAAAERAGFNDEWFKIRHPGGAIGRSYK